MAEEKKKKTKLKTLLGIGALFLGIYFIVSLSGDIYYNISTGNLNVRSEPSKNAKIIGKLETNDMVKVIEIIRPWARVNYKDQEAYVAFKYLSKEKNYEFEKKQKAEKTRKVKIAEARQKRECRQSLQCMGGELESEAAVYCPKDIERFAQYQHEWTDGMLEPKFSHTRWKDQTKNVITFIGDKIKFQNGFGAWQNYIYECDIDVKTEIPLYVRVRPGRL